MAIQTVSFHNNHASQNTSRTLARGASLLLLLLLFLVFYFPLGCAVGSSSGVVNSTAQQNQAATSTGVVAPQFFGMVVKSNVHQPTVLIGARRLWDSGVTWAAIEPTSGSFNWTALDAEVSAAQAAGMEVTLTLGMTPTWASSQPTAASAYGAGATAMPRNLADWDAYVTAVATRYQGRIASYEVWNNPSDATYWSGSSAQLGSDMATLAAHAATAIHASDADAKIVAPAFDANGMTQFLAAGGSASVDIFTTALSLAGQAPEALVTELSAIRTAMLNTSAETKPLWNDQPSWTLPSSGLSDTDQASYVARAVVLNASSGITRLAWYAWDENQNTALRLSDSNAQPTAAAFAYGVIEGWLSGAQINGCSANAQQLWSCQLVRNGQPSWILWSTAGAVQASGLGMTTITDLAGNQQAIGQAGTITLGAAPVLLQ
jgi:hypothetical protein